MIVDILGLDEMNLRMQLAGIEAAKLEVSSYNEYENIHDVLHSPMRDESPEPKSEILRNPENLSQFANQVIILENQEPQALDEDHILNKSSPEIVLTDINSEPLLGHLRNRIPSKDSTDLNRITPSERELIMKEVGRDYSPLTGKLMSTGNKDRLGSCVGE